MKNKTIIISLFLIICTAINAQDVLTSQKNYADGLFLKQKYFDAITEYKRLLVFDSTSIYHYQTKCRIGECYKAGLLFDDAIKYFNEAERVAISDSGVFDCRIQVIRLNILRKTTERAFQLCDNLEKDERFTRRASEINYWRGWAYMFADDWTAAAKTFARIDYGHELRKLADQTEHDKVSVTFAKVISYILPGAGSIYTGNILSGLMSMAWNAAAGYWTIDAFASDRAFDGVAVGALVWLRFYRGSIQNAEEFAIQKNIEVANKSLRYLQNEYKGPKP
jgi:hypothetical protein